MLGFGLALIAGGVAIAYAKNQKEGAIPTTESGVAAPTTSTGVIVDNTNGTPVATMPREGANTPPAEDSPGQSGTIIEMPPMIIERGTQVEATKPAKVPCNCIKAPCGPCGGSTTTKPLPSTTTTKPLPTNTGIVPPILQTKPQTSKMNPTGVKKPLPIPIISIPTKGLTKAAVGDRVVTANVWAGPQRMIY